VTHACIDWVDWAHGMCRWCVGGRALCTGQKHLCMLARGEGHVVLNRWCVMLSLGVHLQLQLLVVTAAPAHGTTVHTLAVTPCAS
jgi:hypothetical protein